MTVVEQGNTIATANQSAYTDSTVEQPLDRNVRPDASAAVFRQVKSSARRRVVA
jgi:hypothetical protein